MTPQEEAREAAACWGGVHEDGAESLRLIRNRENAVFEAMLPAGRAALRLHRPGYQTAAAIRSELWWCAALAGAGVAAPRPLPASGGALLCALSTGRLASAIAWVDGAAIGEAGAPLAGDGAALYRRIGRLIAGLHAATDRLTLPPEFTRPRWDIPGLVGEAPFWGRFWDHPALTPPERAAMAAIRDHLRAILSEHAETGDFGLIHADVLRENVLDGPGGLTLIDFDDCGFGFRLYDLGTALSQNLAEPRRDAIAEALLAGYEETRPLGPAARALLPAFTLMRCCASVGWTISRLPAESPVHRAYIDRALRLARALRAG